MGAFLAAFKDTFNTRVLIFSALTTVFLQILSNLANDYGDSIHGADGSERKGPERAVQSGLISKREMKIAIVISVILSLLSGLYLLYISLGFNTRLFLPFLFLGIVAIAAAITYTAGSRPYGYAGLGDISVMIFFGVVGVLGSYYLHSQGSVTPDLILPALTCGFFSVAVLNVNNIRDIKSDKAAGKLSIPVRVGRKSAIIYHWGLLISGWLCAIIFTFSNFNSALQLLYLISLPLFVKNAVAIYRHDSAEELDPYLRQLAASTLIFVLLFGIGLSLS
jgi:1,4-dihydroxy-2-naphthoate octaprenyltransferase